MLIDLSFSQTIYLLSIMDAPFKKFSNVLEVSLCSYFSLYIKWLLYELYILCLKLSSVYYDNIIHP